ncbi:MAG: hypothetical protein WBC73_22960 [Phormidesmis sp.]
MAGQKVSLSALWQSAPQGSQTFQLGSIAELCEPTRRYLTHAIAPFTPLAHAVRLKMHRALSYQKIQPHNFFTSQL